MYDVVRFSLSALMLVMPLAVVSDAVSICCREVQLCEDLLGWSCQVFHQQLGDSHLENSFFGIRDVYVFSTQYCVRYKVTKVTSMPKEFFFLIS